jgi:hypothetical protein
MLCAAITERFCADLCDAIAGRPGGAREVVEWLSGPATAFSSPRCWPRGSAYPPETVKTHLKHLYDKLGVTTRRQAAVKAAELTGRRVPASTG